MHHCPGSPRGISSLTTDQPVLDKKMLWILRHTRDLELCKPAKVKWVHPSEYLQVTHYSGEAQPQLTPRPLLEGGTRKLQTALVLSTWSLA